MIPDAIDFEPGFELLLGATVVAALGVGFLGTAIGGGIGLVLTPTLSLVLPPAVVLALIAAAHEFLRSDRRPLLLAPVGYLTAAIAAPELGARRDRARVAAVAAAPGVAGANGRRRRAPVRRGAARADLPAAGAARAAPAPAVGVAAGLVMGVASMVAHSVGVVLNLYLLALRLPTTTILATNNALIVFTNAVKLVGYRRVGFLTGAIMLAAVLSIPALAAGAWLGVRVGRRIPRRAFELTLIGIAIVGAVRLLLR
jgi:uncharacterized membrane protein YfcA